MWIETLPNGKIRYVERYKDRLTGKLRKVSIVYDKDTARNRKQAVIKLNLKIDEIVNANAPDRVTFGQLCNDFLVDTESRVKPSTYLIVDSRIRSLLKILGKDTLVCVINAYFWNKSIKLSDAPTNRKNVLLIEFKAIMKFAYRNDLVESVEWLNKLKPLPEPSKREKVQDKFLEKSEAQRLLSNCDREDYALWIKFLLLTGMRVGESQALRKEDIDLNNRTIHIHRNYDRKNHLFTDTKTIDSDRTIYIQDELVPVIKDINKYMNTRKMIYAIRNDLFIVSIHGDPLNYDSFRRFIKIWSEGIDKKVSVHTLRHTHASLLIEVGMSLDAVSHRLGHADSKVTNEIYTHLTEKMRQAEYEQISKIALINAP